MAKSNSTLETEASRVIRGPKPKNTQKIQNTRTKVQGNHHEYYWTAGLRLLKGQEVIVQLVEDPGWVVAWGRAFGQPRTDMDSKVAALD